MIHRVREPLSLQTQGRMGLINKSTLPLHVLQRIRSVKLQPWCIGVELQHSSRLLMVHHGRQPHLVGGSIIQHIVNIKATRELVDFASNGAGFEEIIWCSLHRDNFACGDELFINWSDVGTEDLDFVGQDIARGVTTQVPIGMLSEVYWGGLV